MVRLLNTRTGDVLADQVELADTHETRRRGLLGRDGLDPSSGLVLSPCWAVHMFFMRFSIDVLFLDAQDVVVRIVRDLAPWRIAVCRSANTTVELAAGALRGHDVIVGDRLRFVRADLDRADASQGPPASAQTAVSR